MSLKQHKIKPLGANVDISPAQLGDDLYSYVKNISFKLESAFRVNGYAHAGGEILEEPLYLIGNRRPNAYWWVYPGLNGIYVTDQANHHDISPVLPITPIPAGFWTGAELNGIVMLNNGQDAPWYWDSNPVNPVQPLPNFPENTTAGWLRAYKYFAFAGNITENDVNFENQVYWSASVAPGLPPEDWQPLPSNDAGDNIFADTQGSIVDAHQLRDTLILAKNHSMYLASYVGGRFIFNFRKISESQGVLSTNCMVEHQGKIFMFSDGDIIVTDGQQIESICNERIRKRVFDTLNAEEYERCFVTLYSEDDEIWFCYPSGNNIYCDTAVIYDISGNNWGFRALEPTNHIAQGIVLDPDEIPIWLGDSESWESDNTKWSQGGKSEIADGLMMASVADLYAVGISDLFNGEPVNAVVEKLTMDFGSREINKLLSEVWIYINGQDGEELTIRVGAQDNEFDNIRWSKIIPFVIGVDEYINTLITGKYLSIRIEGNTERVWSIHQLEFMYHEKGRW